MRLNDTEREKRTLTKVQYQNHSVTSEGDLLLLPSLILFSSFCKVHCDQ